MIMVKCAEQGIVWAINPYGVVWRWRKGAITEETIITNAHHGWTFIKSSGGIKKVDVGYNSQVIAIEKNTGYEIFRTGVTAKQPEGTGWQRMTGSGNK
jgi:hypothetical protein